MNRQPFWMMIATCLDWSRQFVGVGVQSADRAPEKTA